MSRYNCLYGFSTVQGKYIHWIRVPKIHCPQCKPYTVPCSLKCIEPLPARHRSLPFCTELSCSGLGILPTRCATYDPFTATRVGEADNPRPDLQLNWAITNPTSIVSKTLQYRELIRQNDLDVITASETAATKVVQRQFSSAMRTDGFRAKWSMALPDRVERTDMQPSLRGKASGVAMFAKWPIRHLDDTISQPTQASARLVHVLLDLNHVQVQCVVIYGLAQSNTDKANHALLLEALAAVDHYALPYLILGDFNCNPLAILAEEAEGRRLTDLKMLHLQQTGTPMPPTCRSTTWPDNAMCCPTVAKWIRDIRVCPPGDFDTHQVVLFKTCIPEVDLHAYHLPLPKTRIDLRMDESFFPQAYDLAETKLGQPKDLQTWAKVVECAADQVYRQTQLSLGVSTHALQPLPRAYRGRRKPRKPERIDKVLLTTIARPGDFAASNEIARHSTMRKVKQVRRVQSLYGRLVAANKKDHFDQWHDLHLEWQAILSSYAFRKHFVAWCQCQPELGPPAMFLPTEDYLFTLLQLLKHHTQSELVRDKQIHADRAKYARHLDKTLGGHRVAYASIREQAMPPLTEIRTELCEDAIVLANDDGTVTAFLDNPKQFAVACPVVMHEVSCQIVKTDPFSISLKPCQPLPDLPETVTITQDKIQADPGQMLDQLTNYWCPFWNSDGERMGAQQEFDDFLQQLPQHMPAPALNLDDDALWKRAIATLKVPSARGVDAISSSELQQLPPLAVQSLKCILLAMTDGFPADAMLAITVPIAKVMTTPAAGQIRPITVLPQLYRLWAKVCTHQILAHFAMHMPPDMTGFLKGRGPAEAYLRQQLAIELCHWRATPFAGLSIDLLKCFNTIAPWAVRKTLEWLGIPPQLTRQWFQSLQGLTRI